MDMISHDILARALKSLCISPGTGTVKHQLPFSYNSTVFTVFDSMLDSEIHAVLIILMQINKM